jgi:hypothetical protein
MVALGSLKTCERGHRTYPSVCNRFHSAWIPAGGCVCVRACECVHFHQQDHRLEKRGKKVTHASVVKCIVFWHPVVLCGHHGARCRCYLLRTNFVYVTNPHIVW